MTTFKILVVEDAEIAQRVARIVLTGLSCEVDIAANGQKAIEMFKQNEYNLIVMDIGLPDITGIEVTKEIRKIENNQSHIPIIALTANYDESYKSVCLEAGMDGFLIKPLTKEKGQEVVNKYLKK